MKKNWYLLKISVMLLLLFGCHMDNGSRSGKQNGEGSELSDSTDRSDMKYLLEAEKKRQQEEIESKFIGRWVFDKLVYKKNGRIGDYLLEGFESLSEITIEANGKLNGQLTSRDPELESYTDDDKIDFTGTWMLNSDNQIITLMVESTIITNVTVDEANEANISIDSIEYTRELKIKITEHTDDIFAGTVKTMTSTILDSSNGRKEVSQMEENDEIDVLLRKD